ncbi:hypothetical protein J5N97_024564 [Dioscorea zingiberensis]|uniref:Protein kinase domain-containing protein n=1 Tax=Dioscorea zingiberensis TaxID=325984 RepID=A0A9D5C847_9LILI|nr:hypothetical protein J5N97_024564 [Dioscorea zingiberensis]
MEIHAAPFSSTVILLSLFSCFMLWPVVILAQQHNNQIDLMALLDFKASIQDPFGVVTSNWTTNTSFCNWSGVVCSRRRPRVTALMLNGFLLQGTISPSLANLSFLAYLDLSNNSLQGPIPDQLDQLRRLRYVNLGLNQLSGSIPASIFNMSVLTTLYLNDNILSGTLSNAANNSGLVMLPRLQIISVSTNQLTGPIPPSFSQCHDLQALSLSINQFTGTIPTELASLTELRLFYLGQNNLTGTFPSFITNLTKLTGLGLSQNNLHGRIPWDLGKLKLETMNVAANALTGPIPSSLANISTITLLDVASNYLTGDVPVQLGMNKPVLYFLNLQNNSLTGGLDFISSLSNCKSLRTLDFSTNELTGVLPDSIANLSVASLQRFYMHTNYIKGKIHPAFGNLSNLVSLNLWGNEFTGTLPLELTKLSRLQVMYLGNNRIQGAIPHEIGRLQRMVQLTIDRNELSGEIPDSIGNMSRLQALLLSDNNLSSRIPGNIWGLSGLLELNLSFNHLQGALLPETGNISMKSLSRLDLSANQFSGVLPNALGDLQMLATIILAHNSFQGPIPPSFKSMLSVEYLDLSSNSLSGEIPEFLSKLKYLTFLNLSFNRFRGRVPFGGTFQDISFQSLMGNEALCGESRLSLPPCPATPHSRRRSGVRLLIYILPATALPLLLVACFLCFTALRRRRRRRRRIGHQQGRSEGLTPIHLQTRLISYHELLIATNNFSEANLLGRGGCSSVFKGHLEDGLVVAIKVIDLEKAGAATSFDRECEALRMVRHRNLVRIISTYFGIARILLGDISKSVASASMPGTLGYMPPEYASTWRISTRGDVYSYGILVLETFTGKRPTDAMFAEEMNLRQWVSKALPGALLEIVDANLLRDYEHDEREAGFGHLLQCLLPITEIGLLCSSDSPMERISMKDVVPRLKKIKTDYESEVIRPLEQLAKFKE